MSNTRQRQRNEEIKRKILDCAREIIDEDGVGSLSIRKITNRMEYSPGIIYHYFKSKQDILDCIMLEGYERILSAIAPITDDLSPDEMIRISFKNYIFSALTWRSEWKAFMLSSADTILAHTSILEEKSSEKRRALAELCHTIENGIEIGTFATCDVELTAQVLWSAMYGLLARLMIEENITQMQQNKLIDRQLDILIKGILR
ncbi:MAG: TetR/AcrR family transcriptional regulator [Clostridiales Family XIII bacterium]|jgi:AcrR family transcriptional regulator|nr:TetR/AcrR family transcriptional regulator [Clostridiales Family XIII bacterium]